MSLRYFRFISFSALLASLFLVTACDTNSTTHTTQNPNPEKLKPTGSIQGVLLDATTNDPVVGAVINIGVATATTNQQGIFIFTDVPATSDLNDGFAAGAYVATIDTSGVTSPINMASSSGSKYSLVDVTGNALNVVFSSFDESETGGAGGGETNSSNHDTPIVGLVATATLTIGKLSTQITGIVFDTNGSLAPAGVVVEVWTQAGNNLVAKGTTNDSGAFTFSNLEAGVATTVVAYDTAASKRGTYNVAALTEGAKFDINSAEGGVTLALVDNFAPIVSAINISDGTNSFGNLADIGATTTATVTFTFNEALATNGYSEFLVQENNVASLRDDVTASYAGTKSTVAAAANIGYTMAWNTERTELTVTLPALAASSVYSVTIGAANQLMDIAGAGLNEAGSVGHVAGTVVASFTTGGGATVDTGPTVTVVTTNIDSTTTTINLDWIWTAGASSYNVYRSTTTAGAVTANLTLLGNVATSSYTDVAAAFINGELTQSHSYEVRAVNSDGVESTTNTAVSAADTVGPGSSAGTAITAACSGNDIQVTFHEEVNETDAESAANYTVNDATPAAVTVNGASLDATLKIATLTIASGCATGFTATVGAGVKDLAGNATGATNNTGTAP